MTAGAGDAQRAAFDARVRAIRAMGHRRAFDAFGDLRDDHVAYRGEAVRYRNEELLALWEEADCPMAEFARRLGMTKQRVSVLLQRAREMAAHASERPEPQPVVAAIVTSRRGVLVTERQDGRPPWGFVTGQILPGESPADAAVREVKEEAGLVVRHGSIIGRRVHPLTSRHIVYMTAELAGRVAEPVVGDERELKAAAWMSLAEADAVMPDMFPPVRAYLQRALRKAR